MEGVDTQQNNLHNHRITNLNSQHRKVTAVTELQAIINMVTNILRRGTNETKYSDEE